MDSLLVKKTYFAPWTNGLSYLQIANELCLYEAVVKTHVRHILGKLRMTRTEVAKYGGGRG